MKTHIFIVCRWILIIWGGLSLAVVLFIVASILLHRGHGNFDFTLDKENRAKTSAASVKPSATLESGAVSWSAFSTIEPNGESGDYLESIFMVNEGTKPNTFSDTTLAPGEGVRFIHSVAASRKDSFSRSISVDGEEDGKPAEKEVPIKMVVVKETIRRENLK